MLFRSPIFVFVLTLLFISVSKSEAQPELNAAKVERNVVFGMYSGLALLMDVYYPAKPNGLAILHISGSGWSRPQSYDAPMLNHQGHVLIDGKALVAAGYTLFSINHRAAPRFTYPAAVEDAQRAVRFIRYHADNYGIDPSRIGAIGGSSGGHLVSMLGTLDGEGDPSDESPINRLSAKVQCVVTRATPSILTDGENGELFLGIRAKEIENRKSYEYKLAQEASPNFHVSKDDPPMLLIHGDQDESVAFEMSERFLKTLQSQDVVSKLIRVPGGGHGSTFKGATTPPDTDKLYAQWFDKHLKGR